MNVWTYEELLKANSVLDMYRTIETAGEALTDMELKTKGGK